MEQAICHSAKQEPAHSTDEAAGRAITVSAGRA